MSVKFRSRQAYLSVAHEELFHVGVQNILKNEAGNWIDISGGTEAKEAVSKLPDPDNVGGSYCFSEGTEHNDLTLERDDVIEAMRAYIQRRGDNLIVELDAQDKEPAEPEGTPFVAKRVGFILTPVQYRHCSTAEGKTFHFNMGAEANKYITTDVEEINILREYAETVVDSGYLDPTNPKGSLWGR